MNNKKYFSLKTKVTISIVSFVLVVLAVVLSFSYTNARRIAREDIKDRLLNMVSIAVLQINGDNQSFLKTREDENSLIYKDSIKILKNIQKNATDIYYIYTMKENEKGEITFILDPDDADPNNISHIGEVYNDPSQFLKDNFVKMDKPVVEDNFYTDEWGTWLSGYAPFYDSLGKREGILGIDINASSVVSKENHILIVYILTFIISGLFATILGIILSKKLTSSIINLTNFLKNIEDKGSEIKNISNDEVGELADTLRSKMEEVNISQQDKDASILEKNRTLERINKLMVGRELEMIKLKKEMLDLKMNSDKNK